MKKSNCKCNFSGLISTLKIRVENNEKIIQEIKFIEKTIDKMEEIGNLESVKILLEEWEKLNEKLQFDIKSIKNGLNHIAFENCACYRCGNDLDDFLEGQGLCSFCFNNAEKEREK